MVANTPKPILTLLSIGIAVLCAVLLIVIAATPSYFNTSTMQLGAWKYCVQTSSSVSKSHSIMSRTHRLRTLQQFPGGGTIQVPPGGFPGGGGGSITVPGGGSVTVPSNPGGGTITIDPSNPQLPGGGSIPSNPFPGGTIPNPQIPNTIPACVGLSAASCASLCQSNPSSCIPSGTTINTGGGSSSNGNNNNNGGGSSSSSYPNPYIPSTVPLCARLGYTASQCVATCNTAADVCSLQQQQQSSGTTVCGTADGQGDSKYAALRAFLVLAIILSAGVIVVSLLSILLSSHTSTFLMVAASLALAAGFSALISWAIVASLIQGADGVKLWYGFGLQVVVNVALWLVGGMLMKASIDAKGNQVTQATVKHTQSNEAKTAPVPLQPTSTIHQQWQPTQQQPQYGYPQQQPAYGYPQQPQYGYPQSQPYGTSPPLQANPAYNQQ